MPFRYNIEIEIYFITKIYLHLLLINQSDAIIIDFIHHSNIYSVDHPN